MDAAEKRTVKDRVGLADVVSDFLSLKRVGKTYRGLCPFHDEKRPSFTVYPETGRYHCYGSSCRAQGDVVDFVVRLFGLNLAEAVRYLETRAEFRAGMERQPSRLGGKSGTEQHTLLGLEPTLKPRVSYSMLMDYSRCPLRYRLTYTLGLREKVPRFYFQLGRIVHLILADFEAMPIDKRSLEYLHECLDEQWKSSWFSSDQEEQRWHINTCRMLTRYWERYDWQRVPVASELPFSADVGDYVLTGRIDRVYELEEGGYEIVDYKLSRPKNEARLGEVDLQMTFYYYGFLDRFKQAPQSLRYYYLSSGDSVCVQPVESAMDAGLSEIVSVAQEIYGASLYLPRRNRYCQDCRFPCPLRWGRRESRG